MNNFVIRMGLMSFAVATAMPSAALAADVRVPVKAPVAAPVAVFNWSGCYIGGQLGAQRANVTGGVDYPADPIRGTAAFSTAREFEGDGALLYGGQIGCNWRPGGSAFILGIEGDYTGIRRDDFSGEIFRFGGAFATDHFNATGHYGGQISLRLRAGLTFDRMMLYLAGGVTRAKVSVNSTFLRDGDGSLAFAASDTRDGWNLGGGLDFALANSWTMGVEYRYTDYGSFSRGVPTGAVGAFSWQPFTVRANDLSTQDIRLRFNYMFGGASPVVARY